MSDEKDKAMLEAIRALTDQVKALTPKVPEKMTADELQAKLMAEIRGQRDDIDTIGLVEVVSGCVSDTTQATFDAEIHFETVTAGGRIIGKRTGPGKVVRLMNYKEPAAASIPVAEGGMVPMSTHEKGPNGELYESDSYRQWKWTEFFQTDIRRFVGKPLPAHMRPAKTVAVTK